MPIEKSSNKRKKPKQKKKPTQTQTQTQKQSVIVNLSDAVISKRRKSSDRKKRSKRPVEQPQIIENPFARVLAPQVIYPTNSLFQQQQQELIQRQIPIRNEFMRPPPAPAPAPAKSSVEPARMTKEMEQLARANEMLKQQKLAESKLKQDIQTAEPLLPYASRASKLAPASPAEISLLERQKRAFVRSQEQQQSLGREIRIVRDSKTKKILRVLDPIDDPRPQTTPVAEPVEQQELGLPEIIAEPMTFA
jgi:hypothetical protein